MPSSRHVRMTRSAISPRFAIRTFAGTAHLVLGSTVSYEDRSPALRLVTTGSSRDPSRAAGSIAFDVRRVGTVDSTNRVLLDLARRGAGEGVVVVADHQTAGRGRLGRTWESAP